MLTEGSARFVVILIKFPIDVGIVVNRLDQYVPGNLVMIIGVSWGSFLISAQNWYAPEKLDG